MAVVGVSRARACAVAIAAPHPPVTMVRPWRGSEGPGQWQPESEDGSKFRQSLSKLCLGPKNSQYYRLTSEPSLIFQDANV